MRIDKTKCVACGRCAQICTVSGAQVHILRRDPVDGHLYYEINEDECVDCGLCKKLAGCETDAMYMPDYGWPRIIRAQFSDPVVDHPVTQGHGRGTEEMKTNEVTGIIPMDHVGLFVEFGRPAIGARYHDVQMVAQALAKLDVEFEPCNPCTALMSDPKTGTFKPEVLDEKVLSTILEMVVPIDKAIEALRIIKELEPKLHCVASVALASLFDRGFHCQGDDVLAAAGLKARPNGKMTTGLGRPLAHPPQAIPYWELEGEERQEG